MSEKLSAADAAHERESARASRQLAERDEKLLESTEQAINYTQPYLYNAITICVQNHIRP